METILSQRDVSRDFVTRGRIVSAMNGLSLDVGAREFLTIVGPRRHSVWTPDRDGARDVPGLSAGQRGRHRCRGHALTLGVPGPGARPVHRCRQWHSPGALAWLFIIWFGIGELSEIILASTLTFFLTFYGTFSGLRAVELAYLEIAWVMGASGRQIFFKISSTPPAR